MLTWLLYFAFILITLLLAVIDYFTMRLPDKLTLSLLGIGLLYSGLMGIQTLLQNAVTALFIGGVFAIVAYVYPKGMGMGDAKYVTALALFLGLMPVTLALAVATLAALVICAILIVSKRITIRQQIPFGPFLTAGAWVAIIIF